MDIFTGLAKVVATGGPWFGIITGLIWLLWRKDSDHRSAMLGTVPQSVYEDLCEQRNRQADLLGKLSESVAILVDRRPR